MDIFKIHKDIIDEYKTYIESFVNIKDERIKEELEKEMKKGVLCPDPLIQFNPSFKYDKTLQQLCDEKVLNPKLSQIFKGYTLYKHQVDALELGSKSKDFVVTSGTGSGKSLTYIGTLFHKALSGQAKDGIQAIIVYPMNALINSQTQELEKFEINYLADFISNEQIRKEILDAPISNQEKISQLENETGQKFPITYKQYTGQEGSESRNAVKADPPNILLTNYMMLELIMTRSTEVDSAIRQSIKHSLSTLVFDEMHTYKGRQGADVSMLIRRIKGFVDSPIQCIGTSATMSSGKGNLDSQKREVAEVAENLFGASFELNQIISETLTRVTDETAAIPSMMDLKKALVADIDVNDPRDVLHSHPLAIWLECEIGLEQDGDWLKRRFPISIPDIVGKLEEDSGEKKELCEKRLKELLQWAENVNTTLKNEGVRLAYFPFRLHQFISQTGSVYVTLEEHRLRKIQMKPGYFIPAEDGGNQRIYPLVFSRITGHEFICVKKNYTNDTLEPRAFRDAYDEDESTQSGYIILEYKDEDTLWSDDMIEQLPDPWFKTLKNGNVRMEKKYANRIPTPIYFNTKGQFSDSGPLTDSDDNIRAWFMPAKLLFDPTCFAFYDLKSSESTKLMTLGNEGRSTATTILSLASVKQLGNANLSKKDQKLLSFTDNRQDASLQAGHFNDFINIGLIRSSIFQALSNATDHTLDINLIGEKVAYELGLPQETYAQEPGKFAGAKRENEEALIDYLTIRILQDLKRAWRYTMPNLEQCALLKIGYKYLEDEINNPDAWSDIPYLNNFTPEERYDFVENTLDFFRTSNAIKHRFFFNDRKGTENTIKSKLNKSWGLSTGESIPYPNYLRYESVGRIRQRGVYTASIGKQSAWGKYASSLLNQYTDDNEKISGPEFLEFCQVYFNRLQEIGLLSSEEITGDKGTTTAYLLLADKILWQLGDFKTVRHDKVRVRINKEVTHKPNEYFQNYYRQNVEKLKPLKASEHTGQIRNELRKQREKDFRDGKLTTMFCSPTMELGIDISNLNIVHMRNVPPSPANYAQRSGRAGRSGQGALVITYCSQYSPHDRNYFENKIQMVSGIVLPPRISLDNEELIRSHIQAMYFLETGLRFSKSITEVLDELNPSLSLKNEIKEKLSEGHDLRKRTILTYIKKMLNIDQKLANIISVDKAEIIIDNVPRAFDRAFDRWRKLYNNAIRLRDESRAIIDNPMYTKSSDQSKQADRSERFAKRQLVELRNDDSGNSFSSFYPFRYLAAEGFLPGYNFTKLPIRVAINGHETTEYLSRPRLIALQEFGPRNVIYHNGQSYEIKRISTNDIEKNVTESKAKISKSSGYFMIGDEYSRETCPITNDNLSGQDDYIISNLLLMDESTAEVRQRITSEEEERMRLGYDVSTYFSLPKGMEANDNIVVKSGSDDLLKIMFMPTAKIVNVNRKWNRSKRDSFLVDKRFGYWKKETDLENDDQNNILPASLYTDYDADALYIQPVKKLGLDSEQIITLQYALKRAIEDEFQIEPSEIAVTLMGEGESSNIFIYEASEGSLGILSQFAKEQTTFRKVIERAYEICHFVDGEDTKPDLGPASYQDLLSYYNQRHHEQVDRHDIKEVLEKLSKCDVEIQTNNNGDYDTHYVEMLNMYDKSSSTEKEFLKYLYDHNLRLPDVAQPKLAKDYGLYVMPDFQYGENIFVFCDGTPHDDPEIKERDRKQRKAMRKAGLRYIVYYYQDKIKDVVEKNNDVFIKVR